MKKSVSTFQSNVCCITIFETFLGFKVAHKINFLETLQQVLFYYVNWNL